MSIITQQQRSQRAALGFRLSHSKYTWSPSKILKLIAHETVFHQFTISAKFRRYIVSVQFEKLPQTPSAWAAFLVWKLSENSHCSLFSYKIFSTFYFSLSQKYWENSHLCGILALAIQSGTMMCKKLKNSRGKLAILDESVKRSSSSGEMMIVFIKPFVCSNFKIVWCLR